MVWNVSKVSSCLENHLSDLDDLRDTFDGYEDFWKSDCPSSHEKIEQNWGPPIQQNEKNTN